MYAFSRLRLRSFRRVTRLWIGARTLTSSCSLIPVLIENQSQKISIFTPKSKSQIKVNNQHVANQNHKSKSKNYISWPRIQVTNQSQKIRYHSPESKSQIKVIQLFLTVRIPQHGCRSCAHTTGFLELLLNPFLTPGSAFFLKKHIFCEVTGGVVNPRKRSKFLPTGSFYRVDFENDHQKVHSRRHRRPRRRQHRHAVADGPKSHDLACVRQLGV